MDQDSIRLKHSQQIADACKSGDVKQLIDALGTVSLKTESDMSIIRLRALELQIRLVDLYTLNHKGLLSLYFAPELNSLSDPNEINNAQTLQQLGNFGEALESFLKNFGQSLKECIKQAAEPSFACDAIVQKLHDQTQAALIVKLLCEDAFHNQEWLIERSGITQSGVDEGIWSAVSAINEFVAETMSGESGNVDEVSGLQQEIRRGIKIATHELELAGQGLLPGLILGGQDGN